MSGAEPQTPDDTVHVDAEDEAFVAEARALLARIALDHALDIVWRDTHTDRVECDFPRQPGLDFDLWFSFAQGGVEFGSGDTWLAEIWELIDSPDPWPGIFASLNGLITGDTRVLCYRPLGRRKVSGSKVQTWANFRWNTISAIGGFAFPPLIRPLIVRNGEPLRHGWFRPAWGSIAFILLLLAIARCVRACF